MNTFHFAEATLPPALTKPKLWLLPIGLAALNAAFVLSQLASFEAFVQIIASHGVMNNRFAVIVALIVTAVEILSLPVLLRLRLSPYMRRVSIAAICLTPLLWLIISAWPIINNFDPLSTGYFGKFISLPFGWWLIAAMLIYATISLASLVVLGGQRLLKLK